MYVVDMGSFGCSYTPVKYVIKSASIINMVIYIFNAIQFFLSKIMKTTVGVNV